MNSNSFDLYTLIVLLIMAVIMPLVGIRDFRILSRRVREGKIDARTNSYRWILVTEWGLVLGMAGYWIAAGRGLAPLYLVPVASGWQWLAIGIAGVAVAAQIWQTNAIMRDPDKLAEARDEAGALIALGPKSHSEVQLFKAVAVTAGVCEEILYRGVLMATLTPLVGTWPAVALSSIIFGLAHAYQGFAGIGKTALVGLVLALFTVFSGSLFVAMILHAVVDLTSGRIITAAQQNEPNPELQVS